MVATPIPPHVVHTVFQYILPPSLPLPAHLLSKRLTERHHFLSISPTDSTSYLCWPSSDVAHVTEALERGVQDTLACEPGHQVRYTALDEETVLAHVRPDAQSPLQIVFAWDAETSTWGYHDARMLPFPEGSLPSLDATPQAASGLQWPSLIIDQPSHRPRSTSPAPDDYWAGYESSGSLPDTSALPPSVHAEDDDKAEAAYWASYAVVHGSGDSTLPSPRLERRRVAHDEKSPDARGPETTFDPLVAHLHLRLQPENGYLSPPISSPQYCSHAARTEKTPIGEEHLKIGPEQWGIDEDDDYGFPKDDGMKMVETNATCEQIRKKDVCTQDMVRNGREDREDGLREAIRGIYRLWRAQSGPGDAGTFIDIVKEALEI